MDFVPKLQVLQFHPDTRDVVRQRINMKTPEEMDAVVGILNEWIQQQKHFKRRDFSKTYLEMTIIQSKGSIERAKQMTDKMCTLKSLLPQYFTIIDIKKDFADMFEIVTPVILPRLTKDHRRVFVTKMWGDVRNIRNITNFFRYTFMMAEYDHQADYVSGIHLTVDFSEINMMDLLSKLNPVELKQVITTLMVAYGMRIQGIHCISASKLIEGFIAILKQFLKPKIVSRIHVYKNWEELHDVFGKDVLPKDFGGDEKSIKEIHADWIEELSSKEFTAYLRDIFSAGTDESCRPTHKFNEDYAGMPGTFRVLRVD
ncbi:uncharacterized protein LOC119833814 [Zerene cesonia]|uniref:uncharacterized protein LOC119833814 n=1 Tax=Zerene cesonia TaxID=33412 RepID=UPI0018E50694|nr:uncharacterized protein LOC119833814 [Zerene cesonia]